MNNPCICFIFCYMYRWSGPPFPSRLFMKRYSNECESYALLARFWRLRCKRSSGPGRLTFSPRNKSPKERKSLSIKAWRKNRNRRHVIFLEGFERRVEIWQVRGEQIRENGREGKKKWMPMIGEWLRWMRVHSSVFVSEWSDKRANLRWWRIIKEKNVRQSHVIEMIYGSHFGDSPSLVKSACHSRMIYDVTEIHKALWRRWALLSSRAYYMNS